MINLKYLRILSITLFLIFTSISWAQITIEAVTPYVDANGGQAINLVATFENKSTTEDQTIEPLLVLPDRWRTLIPLGTVIVAANDSRTIPFSVLVPKSSKAGNHDIVISLEDDSSEAVFTVNVAAVTDLGIEFNNLPERLILSPFEFEVILTNLGNQTLALDVSIDDNLGFSINKDQNQIILEPQQQERILTKITPPKLLDKQVSQLITVRTYDSQTLEQVSSDSATVKLIPAQLSEYANWQLFPASLSISTGQLTFSESDSNLVDKLTDISFTLSGRGKLTDYDDGYVDFNLNSDATLNKTLFSLKYNKPEYGISFSNKQTLSSGAIFTAEEGFNSTGYYRFSPLDNFSVTPYFSAHLNTGVILGLRSNYLFNKTDSLNTTLESHFSFEDNFQFAIRSNYRNRSQGFTTRIGSEYLGELGTDNNLFGKSSLSGRVQTEAMSFSGRLKYSEEGYKNSTSTLSNLDFRFSLRNREVKIQLDSYANFNWQNSSAQQTSSNKNTFGISGSYTLDNLTWRLKTDYSNPSGNEVSDSWTTSLQLLQRYNRRSYLQQQLGLTHILDDSSNDKLSYTGNLVYPFNGMTLKPRFKLEWQPYDFTFLNFESTLESYFPTDFGSTTLSLSYKPFGDDYFSLTSKSIVDLAQQNKLNFEVGATLSNDNQTDFFLSASYSYKFNLPISKKTKVANVIGFLKDSKGKALADILVEVSGQFAQTNSEGRFEIVNIAAGEAYLKIAEGQLPITNRTIPESPHFFKAEAGDTHNFDFTVVDSASINVTTRYEEITLAEDTIVNKIDTTNLLSKLAITLRSETGEVRTLRPNTNGIASVFGLLPDTWTINASLDDKDIEISIENPKLVLTEGDEQSIEIILRPRERKVKFIDGGTITFELNPDNNDGN